MCEIGDRWEPAVWHQELTSVLRDDLGGGIEDGVGGRPNREGM